MPVSLSIETTFFDHCLIPHTVGMHDRPLLLYAPSRALFVVLTGSLLYQALGAAVLLTRTYPFGVKYYDSRPSHGRSSFVKPPMLSSLRPLLHSGTFFDDPACETTGMGRLIRKVIYFLILMQPLHFLAGQILSGSIQRSPLRSLKRSPFHRPGLTGLIVTGMGTLAAAGTSSPPASSCSTTPALPPCARVIPVPILSDNFAYLVVDPQTGKAACVDPAEPAKVLAAAQREGIKLSTLLCTHKHWDHAGGNEEMVRMLPGLEVVTTKFEDIPAATIRLGDDDVYTLGSLSVRALYTPCHTKGHVLFLVTPQDEADSPGTSPTAPVLFSGDTLFVGGCGRFFEGDGAQMVEALMGRVASLSPETLVYCGYVLLTRCLEEEQGRLWTRDGGVFVGLR